MRTIYDIGYRFERDLITLWLIFRTSNIQFHNKLFPKEKLHITLIFLIEPVFSKNFNETYETDCVNVFMLHKIIVMLTSVSKNVPALVNPQNDSSSCSLFTSNLLIFSLRSFLNIVFSCLIVSCRAKSVSLI